MKGEKSLGKSLIAVVGPTASGKSEFAVQLAKKVGGEIISADSRQIYRGMDIGSGKVPGKWRTVGGRPVFVYKGVPHYLIDEASPKRQFSVTQFQRKAGKVIADILKRGQVPILCGGTGHWVDAVVLDQEFPKVKADAKLRRQLEKLSTEQLFERLQKLDPDRAADIDAKNPRRLVRALEIVLTSGRPVPKLKSKAQYAVSWIGLNPGMEVLEMKIKKRLQARLKQGMIKEVKMLHTQGVSWKRLESFGLEYKYCALYLQQKITKRELEDQLLIAIRQYAKRQITWWKPNKDIRWFTDNKKAF